MPHGVGIGSGFVYDSFGNVSNQCDVILYEDEFALKCCINNNEKDTYYNCESVIAVGEIKSTFAEKELSFHGDRHQWSETKGWNAPRMIYD